MNKEEEPVAVISPTKFQSEELDVEGQQPVAQDTPMVFKKKRKKWPIVLLLILILLIAGATTFKVVSSTPKNIFKSNINRIYKDVSKTIDDTTEFRQSISEDFLKNLDLTQKTLYFKGDNTLNIDTDSKDAPEELKYLKDVKLSYELGVDLKKEEAIAAIGANDISVKELVKGGIGYLKASFYDKTIKMEDEQDLELSEFKTDFKTMYQELVKVYTDELKNVDTSKESYTFVVKTVKDAINESLDEKSMKKESATIEINGKQVKTTKVSYVLNNDSKKELVNKIYDKLSSNDEFIKALADITPGQSKDDAKQALKDFKENALAEEIKDDILISIYVKGILNETVGYSIEQDGKVYLSAYKDGKNAEIKIDNNEKEYRSIVTITIEEEKDKKTVTIYTSDGKEKTKCATLIVRSWELNKIDFDYTIYVNNFIDKDAKEEIMNNPLFELKEIPDVTGTIKLVMDTKSDKKSSEIFYSIKWDKYVNIELSYKGNTKSRGKNKGLDGSSEFGLKVDIYERVNAELNGKSSVAIGDTIEDLSLEGNYKVGINFNEEVTSAIFGNGSYFKTELSGNYAFNLNEKGIEGFDVEGSINQNQVSEEELMNKFKEAINKDPALKKLYDYLEKQSNQTYIEERTL